MASYLEEARRIYDLSVESFLYTTFTSLASFKAIRDLPTLGNLLKNLVTSLSSRVAERFEEVRLRQVLSYPAVFLSGRPETTPALYQLMSYTDLVQGVQYPAGGFTAVVDALYRLAEQRGVRTGDDTGVRHVPADVVVSCTDVHHTETALLPKRLRSHSESWWRRRNPGIGTALVMLGVRGELRTCPTTTCCSARTGLPTSTRSSSSTASRTAARTPSTSPSPRSSMRRLLRMATKTSSCSFQSPPIRPSGTGRRTGLWRRIRWKKMQTPPWISSPSGPGSRI